MKAASMRLMTSKGGGHLRTSISAMIMIGLFSCIFVVCTTYKDFCERYVLGAAFSVLSDEKEYRPLYNRAVMPREFFDAKDFGGRYDGLYGNSRGRYEGDYGGFAKGRFRDHGRTAGCDRDHKNAGHGRPDDYPGHWSSVLEQYAPSLFSDLEYKN